MARICCLAGIDVAARQRLSSILRTAGETTMPVVEPIDVRSLGRLQPEFLLVDLDDLIVDRLETLRQLRFVLPKCVISSDESRSWALGAHIAGANAMLSTHASDAAIAAGMKNAMISGCFTDPRFVA
jgi:DNA-binding NarL/FixJ family response regulator